MTARELIDALTEIADGVDQFDTKGEHPRTLDLPLVIEHPEVWRSYTFGPGYSRRFGKRADGSIGESLVIRLPRGCS